MLVYDGTDVILKEKVSDCNRRLEIAHRKILNPDHSIRSKVTLLRNTTRALENIANTHNTFVDQTWFIEM